MTNLQVKTFINKILKYEYISVFLDFKFLDFIFQKQNIGFQNYDVILNFHSFLMRNDVLIFNPYNNKKVDYKDLLMLYSSNKYRQKILKEIENKELSENFGNNFFTFLFTDKKLETDYINITTYNFLTKFKKLTTNNLVYFNSETTKFKNWEELLEKYILDKEKTSFLIISERHLMSEGNKDENLIQITKYFTNVNHITICQNIRDNKNKSNIKGIIKKEKLFDSYIFCSEFENKINNKILHDRYIFTNYFIINSAHSLDYFENKTHPKETQLCISSIVNQDTYSILLSKLKSYKQLN